MVKFTLENDPVTVFGSLIDVYAEAMRETAIREMQQQAPAAEAWMKSNRRWTDRTNKAREGLWADVAVFPNHVEMQMGYSTDAPYGEDLETIVFSQKGRLNIILRNGPGNVLDEFGPKVIDKIRATIA